MNWTKLPISGTRYLVKIKNIEVVEFRTAEFVAGQWMVDGYECSVTVLEFAELPNITEQ